MASGAVTIEQVDEAIRLATLNQSYTIGGETYTRQDLTKLEMLRDRIRAEQADARRGGSSYGRIGFGGVE
ncbi:MAG: hypothetical protein AAF108_02880 [Planctomycetota bacterium]